MRRQKEAERQAAEKAKQLAEARAKQEQELKFASEKQRKALEERERERRQRETEKATEYFNKSDFPRLAQELARAEESMIIVRGKLRTQLPTKKDVGYGRDDYSNAMLNIPGIWQRSIAAKRANNESTIGDIEPNGNISIVGLTLVWDGGHINQYNDGRHYQSWDKKFNIIPIGCNSEGTIRLGIRKVINKRFSTDLATEISLPFSKWIGNSAVQEEALGMAYENPRYVLKHNSSGYAGGGKADGGPCLPGDSLISIPNGFVMVKDLLVGDFVWTVDSLGYKVQAVIIQKTKKPALKNHKMAHVILKDGRELFVSPGHPTIDNRKIGSLLKGQFLDKYQISSLNIIPYKEKYTYDILPYGDTGGYWANNILIGSTLSIQFQKKKHNKLPVQPLYKPLYFSL